ncbi:unnamed protein product [Agarophyton chilense]
MRIFIAGKEFDVKDQSLELCLSSEGVWKACRAGVKGERESEQYGPLSHILFADVVIVYPAGDEEQLGEAVHYANGVYVHGINAQVMSDKVAVSEGVLHRSTSVVIFGGPNVNEAAREFTRPRSKLNETGLGVTNVMEAFVRRLME